MFTVALDDVSNGSSAHYEADLVATTNGTYFLETSHRIDGGNSLAETYSSVPLSLGQWRHVRFALTRSASPTVDVWMDGVAAIASLPIQPPATFERGELYIGGVWAVGPMTWSVHADNVVCDLSP